MSSGMLDFVVPCVGVDKTEMAMVERRYAEERTR